MQVLRPQPEADGEISPTSYSYLQFSKLDKSDRRIFTKNDLEDSKSEYKFNTKLLPKEGGGNIPDYDELEPVYTFGVFPSKENSTIRLSEMNKDLHRVPYFESKKHSLPIHKKEIDFTRTQRPQTYRV